MSAPRRSARIAALASKAVSQATTKAVSQATTKAPHSLKQYSEEEYENLVRLTFQPNLIFHDNVTTLIEISLDYEEKLRTCAHVRAIYHNALIRCSWNLEYIASGFRSLKSEIEALKLLGRDTTWGRKKLGEILKSCAEDAYELLQVLDKTGDVALQCHLPARVERPRACEEAREHATKVRKYIKEMFIFSKPTTKQAQ